jgi:site-specific recombinase XerD
MVSHHEYIKGILTKIVISYKTLEQLQDQPGDLEDIKRDLSKIKGFFQVLVSKIGSENFQSRGIQDLRPKLEYYLNNYSFEKEIDTMMGLYANDKDRLRNMRLKILESLNDKNMIENIENTIKEL